MKRSDPTQPHLGAQAGYTPGEVVAMILIVAVLGAVGFTVVTNLVGRMRQSACHGLMRESGRAVDAYLVEHFKPPLPPTKDDWDTLFGDPGGIYSTEWLVAVLTGRPGRFREGDGRVFEAASANPKAVAYADLPAAKGGRGGVGKDGRLYDPWGRELMAAVNSRRQDTAFNNGFRDQTLHTWGMAEYDETRPGIQPFAMWSFGKDGLKGRPIDGRPGSALHGSDDIISW